MSDAELSPTSMPAAQAAADADSAWATLDEVDEKARAFIKDFGPEEAVKRLDDRIRAEPGAPAYPGAKAVALLHLGRADEALGALEEGLGRTGEQPALLEIKARTELLRDDFDRASETYGRWIRLEPRSTAGWLGKAVSLMRLGRDLDAIDAAEHALRIDPAAAHGHLVIAHCRLIRGQWRNAFAAFEEAAKHDERLSDATSWALYGDCFLERDQDGLALEAYQRAIAADEKGPAGWHGRGTVLKRRGDLESAVEAFEKASGANPRFIAGYLSAGQLRQEQQRFEDALGFFEKAHLADSGDARPLVGLGDVHAARYRYEKARACYEKAAELDPSSAQAWNGLGNSLRALGRAEEAMRSFDKAIEFAREWGWPHYNRAWVLRERGQIEEALGEVETAIGLDPGNSFFKVGRMWMAGEAGKREEARAYAEEAVRLGGSVPGIRISVAQFFADHDDLGRARDLVSAVETSAVGEPDERVELAECLLKIGEAGEALRLLGSVGPGSLSQFMPIVWSFLHMVAQRLAEGAPIAKASVQGFMSRLEEHAEHVAGLKKSWTFIGIERLLARSDLPVAEKFLLATLIDLQNGKLRPKDFSFFAQR